MYVDRIMNPATVTVTEDAKLTHMASLMREHRIHHLPVVRDGDVLTGLVTLHDLQRVAPSPVSTLSVGEANYLLGKLTAKQIMQTELVTCTPDTLVEEAAYLMRQKQIGCLPVIRDGRLAGIVTLEDLLDFFLDITGCTTANTTRIALHLADKTGELGRLLDNINAEGGYIATVVSPLHPDATGMRIAIVRYRADDPSALDNRLRELGYDLITENLPPPLSGQCEG